MRWIRWIDKQPALRQDNFLRVREIRIQSKGRRRSEERVRRRVTKNTRIITHNSSCYKVPLLQKPSAMKQGTCLVTQDLFSDKQVMKKSCLSREWTRPVKKSRMSHWESLTPSSAGSSWAVVEPVLSLNDHWQKSSRAVKMSESRRQYFQTPHLRWTVRSLFG